MDAAACNHRHRRACARAKRISGYLRSIVPRRVEDAMDDKRECAQCGAECTNEQLHGRFLDQIEKCLSQYDAQKDSQAVWEERDQAS